MGVGDGNTVNIPSDGLQFKLEGRMSGEKTTIENVAWSLRTNWFFETSAKKSSGE